MISCLKWVPKGSNLPLPKKFELNEEELKKYQELTYLKLEEAKVGLEKAKKNEAAPELVEGDSDSDDMEDKEIPKDKADLSIYNLDNYDDEPTEVQYFSNINDMLDLNEQNLNPDQMDDLENKMNLDIEAEDDIDLELEPTDSLLLTGRTENEVSQVEVYVYQEDEHHLFVHHDFLIPSFPLSLEWLDFGAGLDAKKGSYVAIATFESEIEIWDLDVVDGVYPTAILGQSNLPKVKTINDDYHIDSVMCLNWNKNHRNLLASSSADKTIKLWDLQQTKCIKSYNHHKDKVQAVQWHPIESSILLSGGYDKACFVFDTRVNGDGTRYQVTSDVECIKWDPFYPNQFYVSTDDGLVKCFDVRQPNQSKFTLHAHDSPVSTLDINPHIPNCLVTGSTDKLIKVWDTSNHKPNMILSRNFDLGQVFALTFNPDYPYQLGMAGSSGLAKIWDISSNKGVRTTFQNNGYKFSNEKSEETQPISLNDDQNSGDDDDLSE